MREPEDRLRIECLLSVDQRQGLPVPIVFRVDFTPCGFEQPVDASVKMIRLPIMKPLARYMEETGISVGQLATAEGLDTKLIKAIVSGN